MANCNIDIVIGGKHPVKQIVHSDAELDAILNKHVNELRQWFNKGKGDDKLFSIASTADEAKANLSGITKAIRDARGTSTTPDVSETNTDGELILDLEKRAAIPDSIGVTTAFKFVGNSKDIRRPAATGFGKSYETYFKQKLAADLSTTMDSPVVTEEWKKEVAK